MFEVESVDADEVSVLYDKNAPLDHDLLTTIIANLLNLKDPKRSEELPIFRIRELLTIVQRTKTTLLNEGRLTESLLAFFALCLHYSVHTIYDCEIIVELITLLQYLSIESLIVEQNNRRPNTLELLSPLEVFQKDEQIDTLYKLEIFSESLDIARQITRETLALSRSLQKMKAMKADERKRAMPKHVESIQPYCIHYVANLCLCHITSVMHQVGNLSTCVGLVEYILIQMLTNVTVPGSSSSSKQSNVGPHFDYAHCIDHANRLAKFVGHYVLDEPSLKQLQLLKVKFSKRLTHPEISYIQYRVSMLRVMLGVKANAKSTESTGISTKKIIFGKGFHIFSECKLALDVDVSPQEDEDETSQAASSKNSVVMTSTESKSHRAGISEKAQNSNETMKRRNHYWELKKTFRPLFLTFSSLLRHEKFHTGFSADYNPDLKAFPRGDFASWEGVQNMNSTAALKYLEGYHYHWCNKDYLPRIVNPMEEIYWVCQYVIEYLVKMAEAGEGFCPSLSQEKQFLVRKLKALRNSNTTVERSTKHNMTGTLPSIESPSPKPIPSATQPRGNVSKSKSKSSSKSPGPSLADMLAKAKAEAQLEARVHRIDGKLQGLYVEDDESDNDDESTNSAEQLEIAAMLNDARPPSRGNDVDNPVGVRSNVWYCQPKAGVLQKATTIFAGVEGNLDNPLENLPSKTEAQEYARKIEEGKRKKIQDEIQFQQYLEDQQELILSKNRAMKAATLRNMRDKMKEELQAKTAMKAQWEEERRKKHIQDMLKAKQQEKDHQEAEMREKYRIKQIKEVKSYQQQREAEEFAMKMEREKMIIARIANQKEADEIRRMLEEEDRMKYLEERRRAIEQKLEKDSLKKLEDQQKRHEKALENVDKMQARVRMGNFVWHNGTYGFYDAVRKKPVNYIQYEDEYGVPYYFDPLNNTYQTRMPTDAPIKHYTDDERKEYDAKYGEGAYDAYKADQAFKESVNQNGGYFDENGEWVSVHGYYDANGTWVEYDGYYNEKGRYVKYAKVQGTLDFMV